MSETGEGDHREFTRVPIKIEVQVDSGGKSIFSEQTRDVSMKGLFMLCQDHALEAGAVCDMVLFLGGREEGIRIEVKGMVERLTPQGMGIRFTEIGLESYEHLHNLVLYNSQDSHKVEQEMKDHMGLKRRE
ncbi:MAG: PilZ domain-containing protein [Nitrospinae bacterium]|nr:PilZ domain-containing protein [Nitrospinota bacterium]